MGLPENMYNWLAISRAADGSQSRFAGLLVAGGPEYDS
jgi:hypothetical protein